jgi:type IV secretion system protein VirD4
MYTLSRLMLTLAVALMAYCFVLAVILAMLLIPPEWRGPATILLTVCAIAVIARRKALRLFTSGGTAAWEANDRLEKGGMLHARTGMILGRVPDDSKWPLGRAVKSLLNTHLSSRDACGMFFDTLNRRKRKQGRLVRLPQAVHTMIVAPTGVGKGVSCIVPFLLTCEESCVVVDFKGENALLTAERRRRMGHKIVILDPFKVVTQ